MGNLNELSSALFDELHSLQGADQSDPDAMKAAIARSKAVCSVAGRIIETDSLIVDIISAQSDMGGASKVPSSLLLGE